VTEATVEVVNELGIHLRAAARIVGLTSQASAQVWIETADASVDGKSLLGITSLLARQGAWVRVRAQGPDEAEIVERVRALIASGFAG